MSCLRFAEAHKKDDDCVQPDPCTRECKPCAKKVCGCIFNGTLTDNCQYFDSFCDMNKLNCRIRPGYQKVKRSVCEKKVTEPEPVDVCTRECNALDDDVCGCIFNGELTDSCQYFTSLCEMEKLNCRTRPGYQQVEYSICEPKTTTVDACIKACDPIESQVCGSQVRNCRYFNNACKLENENCAAVPPYVSVALGNCPYSHYTTEENYDY